MPLPKRTRWSRRRTPPRRPRATTGRPPSRRTARRRARAGGDRLYVTVTAVIVVLPFVALGLLGRLLWGVSSIPPTSCSRPSSTRSRVSESRSASTAASPRRLPGRPSRAHRARGGRVDEFPGRRHRLGRHPSTPPRGHRTARRPALAAPLRHASARPVARAAARARRLAVPQRPDAAGAPPLSASLARGTPIAPDLLADRDTRAVARAFPALCVLTLACRSRWAGPSAVRGCTA